jgi:hypothetical protein
MTARRHDRFVTRALAQALAAATLAFAAGAASGEEPSGALMTSEDLLEFHAGHERMGCYLDRPEEPVWRERMAEDGRLFDMLKGGAEVGSWWVEDAGVICFRYTDRTPGPFCFTGRRRGGYRDFYSAGTSLLVTTTQCDEEPVA